ncbi:hypothetical protein PVK06_027785 [Gossypium arboreum]|uniref:Uncharacterized protein n=1 Tax=Gossypium arboreum TaxID=29729 RepID=A0ABR0P174_GOSAR|nr:hypothetical protein PVK06_027785 [Gossypium arboreum]
MKIVGYDLKGYVLGTINVPLQFVVGNEGRLVENLAFLVHKKKDKFLASDDVLVYITKASTSFEVWMTIERRLIWHLTKNMWSIKQNKLITPGVNTQEFKQGHRGNGCGWYCSRPQCQLCGKVGHVVQTCYYRFDENFSGVDQLSSL